MANPGVLEVGRHLYHPPISVEVEMSVDQRRRLFEHIARVWTRLGETEPYVSVLFDPRYQVGLMETHGEEFLASGQHDLALVRGFFSRNGEPLDAVKSVLEIGCGVGRVTTFLSAAFERVVSIDVSPSHLQLARKHAERSGCRNVEFIQVKAPDDYSALPPCDLIFSRFVLQHDPPPLIAWILSTLLGSLPKGGYCLFQVPTYCERYEFSVSRYLETAGVDFNSTRQMEGKDLPGALDCSIATVEMHALPQKEIYKIFRKGRVSLLECSEDASAGSHCQSQVFFGRKD